MSRSDIAPSADAAARTRVLVVTAHPDDADVRAHASQFGHRSDLEGWLRGLAERAGRPFGLPLAESFRRLTPR